MADQKLVEGLKSALAAVEKRDETEIVDFGKQISPENDILDIHNKVSIIAMNIAATIQNDWSEKEKIEIDERKNLTLMMFRFLVLQWIVAVVLIVFQGLKLLIISEIIFISFFASIIIQTIGIVLAMVVYLYKERKSKPLSIIGALISIVGSNNVQYKNTSSDKPNGKKAIDES